MITIISGRKCGKMEAAAQVLIAALTAERDTLATHVELLRGTVQKCVTWMRIAEPGQGQGSLTEQVARADLAQIPSASLAEHDRRVREEERARIVAWLRDGPDSGRGTLAFEETVGALRCELADAIERGKP